jgi:hypothetical protein
VILTHQFQVPAVLLPLRDGDADINLNLQQALDRARTAGPFRAIDYRQPLDSPLRADDAA